MEIIKSGGHRVPYDEQKVRRSMKRTGASNIIIDGVLKNIEPKLFDGISTRELYSLVRKALNLTAKGFASRYNLRQGILRLGPAGFKFEKYVASILKAHGWNAYVPDDEIEGTCVMHEVDVIAEKDKRTIFIEAKFRNEFRGRVDLKDTMATWSRFLDLVDASSVGKGIHFDEPWIVTNARFSDRAKKFGVCKGIHMIGWNFPAERTFASMVDNMELYPITVLDDLRPSELESFSELGLMLCKEVAEQENYQLAERIGISPERTRELIDTCVQVVECGEGLE